MKYTLFSASWCSNCTLPKTLIAENNLPVDVLDIDENFDRAAEAGVKQIPALLLEDGTLMLESRDITKFLAEEYKV